MKFSTPLTIALCSIAALAISVYLQFSGGKMNIGGNDMQFPKFDESTYLQNPYQTSVETKKNSYTDFTSPDGNLIFKYPSAYSNGEKLLGQETMAKLKLNNVLMFAYQMTVPELQPSYILASETVATTTETVADQIKQALAQQQCVADIQNASSTNPAIFETVTADYQCAGAMNGFDKWHALAALVKKNNGYYIVAAVTTNKNWPNILTDAQLMLDSISVKTPDQTASSTDSTSTEEIQKTEP
jgi:hypothetical protein